MREITKDIEIEGVRYRLNKLPVGMASWLLSKVMGVILSSPATSNTAMPRTSGADEGEKRSSGVVRFFEGFSKLSQEDFLEIQNRVLATAFRYEETKAGETFLPIVKSPGVFAYADLQYDLKTIMALTMQGIEFNILPFFADAKESKSDQPRSASVL